jgi:hypothetical protein
MGCGGYESPYIYIDAGGLVGYSEQFIKDAEPLYTSQHQQPPREPMSVTRHEVETAMMLCEINFCENPSEYVYWILDKLEIGAEK